MSSVGKEYKITELFIHPVKSLKAISVDEVEIDEHGFLYDRFLMITTPTPKEGVHRFMSQRREPAMQLITTSFEDKDTLLLEHPPTGSEFRIPLSKIAQWASTAPVVTVDIWGEDTGVHDIGEPAGFSKFWQSCFGADHKFSQATLVTPQRRRDMKPWLNDDQQGVLGRNATTSFQDRWPGHLVTTKSLEELNARIDLDTDGEVVMVAENFRPNVVIDTDEPYEEDEWAQVDIAGHLWLIPSWSPRCPIPNVNLERGQFEKSKQPTKSMNVYRRLDDKTPSAPIFGMNMINKDFGYKLHVGDTVKILETVNRY